MCANNNDWNYVSVTHKQLNQIAGKVGIKPSDTGTFNDYYSLQKVCRA